MAIIGFNLLRTGRWKDVDRRIFHLDVPASYKIPTVINLEILPCAKCPANFKNKRRLSISGDIVVCKITNTEITAYNDIACVINTFQRYEIDLPRTRHDRLRTLFD